MIRVTSDPFHRELLSLSKAVDKYHLFLHSFLQYSAGWSHLLSMLGEIHVVYPGMFQGCMRC